MIVEKIAAKLMTARGLKCMVPVEVWVDLGTSIRSRLGQDVIYVETTHWSVNEYCW